MGWPRPLRSQNSDKHQHKNWNDNWCYFYSFIIKDFLLLFRKRKMIDIYLRGEELSKLFLQCVYNVERSISIWIHPLYWTSYVLCWFAWPLYSNNELIFTVYMLLSSRTLRRSDSFQINSQSDLCHQSILNPIPIIKIKYFSYLPFSTTF